MSDILETIVTAKRREIAQRQEAIPAGRLRAVLNDAPPVRDFKAALERGPKPAIIAEVKKASPSAGVLRDDFNPIQIAKIYEAHGASAISVLTDEPFFQGRLQYLSEIRAVIKLPVLRKDFLLEPYQVLEARAAGADAVLLIAEILRGEQLRRMLAEVHALGMQALVELYERANLPRVLDAGATIIGVNNRNLRTFETSLRHTLDIAQEAPAGICLVSESGIRTRNDMAILRSVGVHAVLIGETLMRAPDIGAQLRELVTP